MEKRGGNRMVMRGRANQYSCGSCSLVLWQLPLQNTSLHTIFPPISPDQGIRGGKCAEEAVGAPMQQDRPPSAVMGSEGTVLGIDCCTLFHNFASK